MDYLLKVLLCFVVLLQTILSENILYIAPFGSPSHHIWNRELALGLVEKGHNVTMLTQHPKEEHSKNFTFITIEGFFEVLAKEFDMKKATEASVLESIKIMYDFAEFSCAYNLENEGLQTLLNYPNDYKFDLIIIDATLMQCMYPIFDRFKNSPVVTVNLLPPLLSKSYGINYYTSYMPYFSSEFTNHMSFSERIVNFIFAYAEYLYQQYVSEPKQFQIAQKRFGENIVPFEESEKSMNIILMNIDPNLDYPIALPPNIIPVGGLHIKPAKKLPKDIQKILSEAKHGVILFSFGTNIRSDKLSLETRKAFLDAFSKLPQIILWKFESDDIDTIPKNVITRKWLPQRDILAHPNIKLFITQCGGFSSQEAIYHGVPVVGVPFLIDQYTIVKRFVERKLGKSLYHWNLTSSNIYETISEVLNNPIYKQNMQTVSKRYRDQLQTPLERAIFWTEYAMRHEGASQLVLPSRYMPSYKLENIDVLIFLIFAFFVICSVLSFIVVGCRFIFVTYKLYTPKTSK